MREFCVEEELKKKLNKLFKKDKALYEALMNKMEEIIHSENVNHYKNLRSPLEKFKRVHVKSSFVLVFQYKIEEDFVVFYDVEHHDFIYH